MTERHKANTISIRWNPRWPCFAIGFYKGRNGYLFALILWAIVVQIGGEKNEF